MSRHRTYQGIPTNFGGATLSTAVAIDITTIASCTILGTTRSFNVLSGSDPTNSKVAIKTEFEETEGVSYPNTTVVTPTFVARGTENGTVVFAMETGVVVSMTLVDPASWTSSSTTESSAISSSTTGTETLLSSATGTETPLSSATGTGTSSSQTTGTSSSQNTSDAAGSPPSASKTYSSGELTGAAVGCLIAGLLIASLLALLCLKHRTRNQKGLYTSESDFRSSEADGESSKVATGSLANWQKHLPQPESDQTISRLANRTLDDIELFVENFYADRPMTQAGEAVISDMSLFSSPYLGRPLIDIIQTSNYPTVLLKHCIAYYLLQKIDPTRNNSSSLLPREFVIPSQGISEH